MVALPLQSNIIPFLACDAPQGKSNEWYTPSRYIEAARKVMGSIDLDPASCALANRTVQARKFYSKEDNGLAQVWHGCIWLNPPYGKVNNKSIIKVFTEKLLDEYASGNIIQAIFLTPADLDEKWFQLLWQFPICFANHKLWFHRPYQSKASQFFGTAFTYLGPNEQAFIREFSAFGTIAKAIAGSRRDTVQASLWNEVQHG